MPYIKEEAKLNLRSTPFNLATNAGELNYKLTEQIIYYLSKHGLSYQTCNDIVGALDNCKDEFKRRVQNNYEDKKIAENGDVYPKEFTK